MFVLDAVDIEGNPRTSPNGHVAIGAYEANFPPTRPYCVGKGCPCGNDSLAGGCLSSGSTTAGGLLTAQGTNSIAANDLELNIWMFTSSTTLIVFSGTTDIQVPFQDGLRCVGGSITRFPAQVSIGVSSSQGDLASIPGYDPGQTRYYQVWFRDATGPCGTGSNFTNAMEVTWVP